MYLFKIKQFADGSVNKFQAQFVAMRLFQIPSLDCNEIFGLVIGFNSLRVLLSIISANDFVILQVDIKAAILDSQLEETICLCRP
jgi:hypothetical protein